MAAPLRNLRSIRSSLGNSTIPQGNKATIGKDLETLFAKRQSFETAINSGQSIVVRSRLQRYRNELVEAVNNAAIA